MDTHNHDLLLEARKAIRKGDPVFAIKCIDLVLEDSRVDQLKRFYERAGLTSALVVNKRYGRRSTFGYNRE